MGRVAADALRWRSRSCSVRAQLARCMCTITAIAAQLISLARGEARGSRPSTFAPASCPTGLRAQFA
eukprot:15220988-Alexandrium_andersonii.AAC.1